MLPKGAKWRQSGRKTTPARLLGGPPGVLRPVLILLLARMPCTFSLSAPPSPHLFASHLPFDVYMAQNWPKNDPKSPTCTPSNPKVPPRCKQSGYKLTPQLHPRSLEASKCFGGNREANSILFQSTGGSFDKCFTSYTCC